MRRENTPPRRLFGSFLLAMLAAALPLHAEASPKDTPKAPIAILFSCTGDVEVTKSEGDIVKGAFGLSLFVGDEVRVGRDSKAEILFQDNNRIQIGANSRLQVKSPVDGVAASEARSGTPEKVGERSFEIVQNFLRLKDAQGTTSLARLRSLDKKAEIRAISPCQTKIIGTLPKFRWHAADPTEGLRLTVYDEDGIHWQYKVQGVSEFDYPPDAPPLLPDVNYSWTLETTDPLQFPPLRSRAAFFEIITPKEEKVLWSSLADIDEEKSLSPPAAHLLRASLFFRHGLLESAIDETEKALKDESGNATLHAVLAQLYTQVGRTEDALTEYDQLLEKN
jgi:tetratricopeptide (TPR) repeat protein